jgi:hypothetical protein
MMATRSPYWGELHTHSDLSDGNGKAEDCFSIARSHLDFWALADHAFDDQVFYIPPDSGFYRRHGPDAVFLNQAWPLVQELCRSYEAPGQFIPILAYEWTNFQYGHHNVYYLGYDEPIRMPATLPELYNSLRGVDALVIPHHTGYPPGKCGKNWDIHDESMTPFVEVYSVHGSSEEPGGIRPLLTGGSWMGPGSAGGSVQEGLARGHKLGIMASSDAHADHPGAYDLGLIAAYAAELTRPSLWEAFKSKRVYGVTGDRIDLVFSIDGQPLGSTIRQPGTRSIQLDVVAWDKIERIDILKNNRLLQVAVEPDGPAPDATGKVRARFMLEWGWDRKTANEWQNRLEVPHGQILQALPCYRNRVQNRVGRGIQTRSESTVEWTSHTIMVEGAAPARRFADAMWFEVETGLDAPITLTMSCGGRQKEVPLTLREILAGAQLVHMVPVPVTNNGNHWAQLETLAKVRINQGFPTSQLSVSLRYEDSTSSAPGQTDFYYARVTQKNGHRAWSSPIWVES